VLAHGDAAAREMGDYGNWAGRKGAIREDAHREVPISPMGRGGGRKGYSCGYPPIMKSALEAVGVRLRVYQWNG